MPKRKSVIKNIIYELDNDDIEISSDDEVSSPKVTRSEPQSKDTTQESVTRSETNGVEVLSVDSTDDSICLIDSPNPTINGGKPTSEIVVTEDSPDIIKICEINSQDETESDCVIQHNSDSSTSILNMDPEVDSPASLFMAGCENRIPLVTIRFMNNKLSSICKVKVKEFLIKLLKEHQGDSLVDSDIDTDHELDIWPEDLVEKRIEQGKQQIEENNDNDSLFFVDTTPCKNVKENIPRYSQASPMMVSEVQSECSPPKVSRRNPKCFNCDGDHWLRDCHLPRNQGRITEKRQKVYKVGRYHIEDDQKYGHLIPGRISGPLRSAMGLKRHEIPLYIYKMRMFGYPPGWLEEARISHSGITLFDSTGNAILDPEEEDGEIYEAGSKDKFDIKKILDFPGFNVPTSARYVEEAHLYGLPPISEQDSKIAMLQMLAPNAVKAYKRKKLTLFPSAANNSLKEGQAEMDLDSGDEEAVFPSVPPLPDEAPPPPEQPPPPPSSPPPPPPADDSEDTPTAEEKTVDDDDSDAMQVTDNPISEDSLIVIDECYDSKTSSGKTSPSLDDLEKKKQVLMEALEVDVSKIETDEISISDDVPQDTETSIEIQDADKETEIIDLDDNNTEDNTDEVEEVTLKDDTQSVASPVCKDINADNTKDTRTEAVSTPEPKTGKVKATSFGAPVLNIASSFIKLPSDDKFSKQICDVINFENLPNSTGNYEKICNLLKKVKTEVDRIQDS